MQGSKVGRGIHTRASKAMVAILDSHSRGMGSLSRAMGSPSMAMGSLLGAAMDLPQVDAPPHVRSHLRPMSLNTPPLAAVLPAQAGANALLPPVQHDSRCDNRVTTTFLGGHLPSLSSGLLAASTEGSCSLCAALTAQQPP